MSGKEFNISIQAWSAHHEAYFLTMEAPFQPFPLPSIPRIPFVRAEHGKSDPTMGIERR